MTTTLGGYKKGNPYLSQTLKNGGNVEIGAQRRKSHLARAEYRQEDRRLMEPALSRGPGSIAVD